MTIRKIIREWLEKHAYDGLCNVDAECGCDINNLADCECINLDDCEPAIRLELTEDYFTQKDADLSGYEIGDIIYVRKSDED